MQPSSLFGRRVVVVDNEPVQASLLATLLRLEGIVATQEIEATTALSHMLSDPPDAVVLDVKMPELSGSELLARLRLRYPELPAVVLTGFEEHDPRVVRTLDAGCATYVSKPVDLPTLLAKLTGLLPPRGIGAR